MSLNPHQQKIFEFLQTYHDPDTGACNPTVREIARAIGSSSETARSQIRNMMQLGVIERISNNYKLKRKFRSKLRQQQILNFLQCYKDPETGECTPTVKQIAQAVGISRDYASQLLRILEKEKRIEKSARWLELDGDPWTTARGSNTYKVILSFLLMCLIVANAGAVRVSAASRTTSYATFPAWIRWLCENAWPIHRLSVA